ncbi:hypothetical protein ACQPW3_41610 [Actinosynnema sp. CA-248983]
MARGSLPWVGGADSRDKVLERALNSAFEVEEIEAARTAGVVTRDRLTRAVHEDRSTVFAAAKPQEDRYRTLVAYERVLVVRPLEARPLLAEAMAIVVLPTIALSALAWVALWSLGARPDDRASLTASVAIAALLMGLLVWRRHRRRPTRLRWVPPAISEVMGEESPGSVWAFLGFTSLMAAVVWSVPHWIGWSWWLAAYAVPAVGALVVGVSIVTTAFPQSPSNRDRDALLGAFREWEDVLLREGVLPVLYTRINEARRVYSTTLAVREAPALLRSDPLRMHVPTPAGEELARLTAAVPGGSFALAGPRGAGKTNLLRAFCGGRYGGQGGLAVMVAAPVEYVPQEFVVHLFAEVCEAVVAHIGEPRARRWRKVRPHRLVVLARENLSALTHVRTVGSEIAGKGGFKGFELSGKRAVTLAGRALTYPELVKRFREFLTAAVAEISPGRVVIAIDELDRIGVGEPARRFLNEIKAIFDVPGCHYLVSVSTEAQHDFELAGMGLRSVFDSSFDDVVRVDYLDFEDAQKLLRRYVLGMSEQFHALAYVFSGGLARQLVRTARAIVELGRDRRRPLAEVARTLVATELERARLTTVDALTSVDDPAGAADLLRLLDDRPGEPGPFADRVLGASGGSEEVRRLRDGLGARVRFLDTVLGVFTEDLDEERTRAADFDRLARARRYLGGNPEVALGLVDDIRRTWGLPLGV